MTSTLFEEPLPVPQIDSSAVEVRASSWEHRGSVLKALALALHTNGCWLTEQRQLSVNQVKFFFEMRLSAAFEVYSALIGAGLELSQSGHAQFTTLCLLRRHRVQPGSVITVRLQVSFLEEGDLELGMGAADLA